MNRQEIILKFSLALIQGGQVNRVVERAERMADDYLELTKAIGIPDTSHRTNIRDEECIYDTDEELPKGCISVSIVMATVIMVIVLTLYLLSQQIWL